MAPKNFTSWPVSFTPTVNVPVCCVVPVTVASPTMIRVSALSSHSQYLLAVAPKNFTSWPASSTPTVSVPI